MANTPLMEFRHAPARSVETAHPRRPASHLQPGDLILHAGAVFEVDYVAITHGLPVIIRAAPWINGKVAGTCQTFSLAPDEMVRIGA